MPNRILIDSLYRESGTPENYVIKIFNPIKNIKSVRLLAASVPNSVYPIRTGYNDTLNFTYSGAKTATLTQQNYTGSQLAAELQSKIQTAIASTNVTVVYNSQLNKLIFTESGGTAFTIATQTTTPYCIKALGCAAAQTCTSASFTSTYQVDLSYPRYMICDIFAQESFGEGTNTAFNSHSFVVPMTTSNFGDYENYNANSFFQQQERMSNISFQYINVKWFVPDSDDTGLLFFNNVDHQLILEFTD